MMEFSNENGNYVFNAANSPFSSCILRKLPIATVIKLVVEDSLKVRFTADEMFHPVISGFITNQGTLDSIVQSATAMTRAPTFGASAFSASGLNRLAGAPAPRASVGSSAGVESNNQDSL